MLENLLVARATGDMTASTHDYEQLRRDFIADPEIKALLSPFVRTCRTLDVFWPFIKKQAATYAERRQIIGHTTYGTSSATSNSACIAPAILRHLVLLRVAG